MLDLESGCVASLTSSVFQGFLFTPSLQAQWHTWMGDSGRMRKSVCFVQQVFRCCVYGLIYDLFGQEVIALSGSSGFKAYAIF